MEPSVENLSLPGGNSRATTLDTDETKKNLIKCEICGRTMNSASQAEAHYNGLQHIAQTQLMGLPLPPNIDLEKLKNFTSKIGNVKKVKRAKKNMNSQGSMQPSCLQMQPQQQLPITQSNTFNLLPASAADTVEAKKLVCDFCGVSMNSTMQAMAHYAGMKHANKLAELGQNTGYEHYDNTGLSYSSSGHAMNSGDPYVHHFKQQRFSRPMNPSHNFNTNNSASFRAYQTRMLIPCDVCQQLFNSQEQAIAHFNGSRHFKKVKTVSFYQKNVGKIVNAAPSQPKNKHVCGVCQIQVNSEKQMAAHMMGKLHQMKSGQANVAHEGEDETRRSAVQSQDDARHGHKSTDVKSAMELVNPGPLLFKTQHDMNCSVAKSSDLLPGSHVGNHVENNLKIMADKKHSS